MRTLQSLLALEIGDILCDWHDGAPKNLPEGVKLCGLTVWEVSGGAKFISQRTQRVYYNKMAVLVDIQLSGVRVFNFSYDDRLFGVFQLVFAADDAAQEKQDGEEARETAGETAGEPA